MLELIRNPDYKYIRALALFYYRLVETSPAKVYQVFEAYLSDYRRLVFREVSGKCSVLHMDDFVDTMLTKERFCEVLLPRLPKRHVLEDEQ